MYNHKSGIILRKIEEYDLNFLLNLKKESWWGTHSTLIINEQDQKKWFDSICSNQLFMIAENSEGEKLGIGSYTDIDWIGRCLKISGSISKKNRSKYAESSFCAGLDFAFEILNMHRVEAEVLDYHIMAQKIEIQLLGFKVEGCKRKSTYKSGKYYDSYILGILRNEWEKSDRIKKYNYNCNLNCDHYLFEKLKKRSKITS